MKAIILLGGKGTRLRPLTCNTPKPLLQVLNKPSLLYLIELLNNYGIKEFVFCLGYLPETFHKYFSVIDKTHRIHKIKIKYVHETWPLGTGGAIKNAEKFVNDTTLVFNGDILTNINLTEMIKFHKQKKALLTIALVRVADPTVYGLVETDTKGKVVRFLEKPSWDEITCNTINAGIYVFEPMLFELIPPKVNYSLERGLFPLLLEKKLPVYGYVTNSYWIDIGTVDKYLQVHFDLLNNKMKFTAVGKQVKKSLWIERGVQIAPLANFNGKVVIGKQTRVEPYVQLSGFISIGRNCIIKKGAQIVDSVILDDVLVGEGTKINKAIIGKNCKISPEVVISPGSVLGDNTYLARYSRI